MAADLKDMLVPVEKYLGTIYHPDREYVDGAILRRNSGERDHSFVQRELIYFFRTRQINPRQRRAWSFTKSGSTEVKDGRLRTENPAFEIPLAEIFGQS